MAANLFADLDDIRVHLPVDKVTIDHGDDDLLQVDAYRLIRARLAGTFDSTVIDSWSSPATTPEIIREVAGKIIAAKFYATLVAEDEADGSMYAQGLYNEAIATLNDIRGGVLTVLDINGDELDNGNLTETSFWPNDTAPDRAFNVEDNWA